MFKIGDKVITKDTWTFDPAEGEVVSFNRDLIKVKITKSYSKPLDKNHWARTAHYSWHYESFNLIHSDMQKRLNMRYNAKSRR